MSPRRRKPAPTLEDLIAALPWVTATCTCGRNVIQRGASFVAEPDGTTNREALRFINVWLSDHSDLPDGPHTIQIQRGNGA